MQTKTILDYLQYDIPSPLPSYMIAAIETTWDVGTSRTMENTLGGYNEKWHWCQTRYYQI